MAKKILIIEDEPDVATYLATILRANGYETLVVIDPNEAMAAVASTSPDLISLDIMMPEKSGLAMYCQLRREPASENIPILLVSGMASAQEFDFRKYVPDKSIPEPEGYFEKPIEVENYLTVIANLLGSPTENERKRSHG